MIAATVAREFDVAGRLVTVAHHGSGNINDTYLAIFRTTFAEQRIILQRINGRVFPNPRLIMENMRVITEHVAKRLEAEVDSADRIWQIPQVIPTKTGVDVAVDEEGNCWRAISLIASAHSFEQVQNVEHAREAGAVLGQFQRLLSDLDATRLHVTLPDFHITPAYFTGLDAALATPAGRTRVGSLLEAQGCLRFIEERRDWSRVLEAAKARGELKLRSVHGDPKIANIMIDDATGKGTCIVDLDTCMPGLVHYDFGDCMRSACNSAGEEALDLSKVRFDTELCRAIAIGYLPFARSFLNEADHHYLYDSIRLLTFELGLRFFADFVGGDRYFKTRYDLHNLNRARVQFRLCESIETNETLIRRILERA